MLSEVLRCGGRALVLDFPSDWKNELKKEKRLLSKHQKPIDIELRMINVDSILSFSFSSSRS